MEQYSPTLAPKIQEAAHSHNVYGTSRSQQEDAATTIQHFQSGAFNTLNQPVDPDNIANRIRLKSVKSAVGDKDFLPHDELRGIVTRDNVTGLLRIAFPTQKEEHIQGLVAEVIGAHGKTHKGQGAPRRKVFAPRRKIFATLIMMEKVDLIEDFIMDGIEDSVLPLGIRKTNCPERLVQFCISDTYSSDIAPASRLAKLNDWANKDKEDFYRRQETFCAPFFELPGARVCFYHLSSNAILPYLSHQQICVGGYSSVTKVQIHGSHHSHNKTGEVSMFN